MVVHSRRISRDFLMTLHRQMSSSGRPSVFVAAILERFSFNGQMKFLCPRPSRVFYLTAQHLLIGCQFSFFPPSMGIARRGIELNNGGGPTLSRWRLIFDCVTEQKRPVGQERLFTGIFLHSSVWIILINPRTTYQIHINFLFVFSTKWSLMPQSIPEKRIDITPFH